MLVGHYLKKINIYKMIKVNELRVGNLIKFNNRLQKEKNVEVNLRFFASWAGGRSTEEMNPDEEISNYYSPIELTPEILVKCGFIYKHEFYTIGKDLISFIFLNGKVQRTFIIIDTDFRAILYLHELQNLYYSLTGEELDMKNIK
jgi:hypothetical protein